MTTPVAVTNQPSQDDAEVLHIYLDAVRVYRNTNEYHTKPRARSCQGDEIIGWGTIVAHMAAILREKNPAFEGLLKIHRGDILAFTPTPLKSAFLPDPKRQPKHLQRKPQ